MEETNFLCEIDWGLVATFGIGLIAGLIGLVNVRNNIRMSATIKWIDETREMLSEFIVQGNILKTTLQNTSTKIQELVKRNPEKKNTNDFSLDELESLYIPIRTDSENLNKIKHQLILMLDIDYCKNLRELVSEFYSKVNINLSEIEKIKLEELQKEIDSLSTQIISESHKVFNNKRNRASRIWSSKID